MKNKPVILVIDDDPTVLNTMVAVLKEDHSVRPVHSGPMALEFLQTHHADIIILDYYMPDVSGLDMLDELKKSSHTCTIPVIFHTADSDDGSEVEALERGAADYIRKPVFPKTLLTRVNLQLELQAHRKTLEALVKEKTRDLNKAYDKLKAREDVTLNLLARVTDMRDHKTGDHIARTTEFVRIIAEYVYRHPRPGYSLAKEEMAEMISSAKLHDLGKIAIPDRILLKKESLTEEEFSTVKQHPVRGGELLGEFSRRINDSFLNTARDIAYCHHEKWDGTGYPRGLRGEEIPFSARIVAIADVYDALTSERPYKKAFSHKKAAEIIIKDGGTHFDPYLVWVFEQCANKYEKVAIGHGCSLDTALDTLTG